MVVPLCSNVTLLFLQELRAMQRSIESFSEEEMTRYLLGCPHKLTQEGSRPGSISVRELCNGNWMSRLPSTASAAWLHVDHQLRTLHISRSVDAGSLQHGAVVSQCIELAPNFIEGLVGELANIHRRNGEKVREISQKSEVEKKSQATKQEFWNSRKDFEAQLAGFTKKVQDELLGAWRCLLAPWPQKEARETVLAALTVWLDGEATSLASGEFILPRCAVAGQSKCQCSSPGDEPCSCQSRLWLLTLLFMESESMDVTQIAQVLSAAVLFPGQSVRRGSVLRGSRLQRLASSLKRHRQGMKLAAGVNDTPLLLFVDSVTAQLPIEACPSLMKRDIVRGMSPNMTVSASIEKRSTPASGFFVIDPAEDCTGMADMKILLKNLSSKQQEHWQGRSSKPMPEAREILDNLRKKDVFVYLGHGECARRLLRHEQLQLGGPGAAAATTPWTVSASLAECRNDKEKNRRNGSQARGLRSALMLMGCSSVKMERTAGQVVFSDFEAIGLASSALLGGSPLVLGAQWDVLGGDLDKLGRHLLELWLSGGELLPALRRAREKCFLPHLTGAAMVVYGVPM